MGNVKNLMNVDNQCPQLLLVGEQGQGKTTLFNNLTGLNEKTKRFGQAVTENVCIAYEKLKKFSVIDTAGLFSQKIMSDIATLFAAFKLGIISGIMIVVKMDRDDLILKEIEKTVPLFKTYRHLIIIAITHWDLAKLDFKDEKSQDQLKNKIRNNIKEKFNIEVILFISNQKEDYQDIRAQISTILYYNIEESHKITFTEQEIECFFLQSFKNPSLIQINQIMGNLLTVFRRKALSICSYIDTLEQNNPKLTDVVSFIAKYINQQALEEVERFEKQKMIEITNELKNETGLQNCFLIHTLFLKAIEQDVANVIQKAEKKLDTKFLWYLKKCPHCEQIWFKDNRCNGLTFCGSTLVSNSKIDQITKQDRYKAVWNEDFSKFSLTATSESVQLKPKVETQNMKDDSITYKIFWFLPYWKEDHKISMNTGCGKQFNWSSAKLISIQELEKITRDMQFTTSIYSEDKRQGELNSSKKAFFTMFNEQVNLKFLNIKRFIK